MGRWALPAIALVAWIGAGVVLFEAPQAGDGDVSAENEPIRRIVATAPNLTEIVFALGLDKQIAAVSSDSDWPESAKGKAKVGTFWQPNTEAIIAAKPDLTITLGFEQQRSLARRLRRLGYRCLTVDIERVRDFYAAVERIGEATGKGTRAAELISDLQRRIAALQKDLRTREKPRVLWVVQREPLRVAGRQTFVSEMIELAGGRNAIGATLHKYPPIGAETVIACRPDVIIEAAMAPENIAEQREAAAEYWSEFESLPAGRDKRIFVVDGSTVSRLSPRLYEGVATIARCCWPEQP